MTGKIYISFQSMLMIGSFLLTSCAVNPETSQPIIPTETQIRVTEMILTETPTPEPSSTPTLEPTVTSTPTQAFDPFADASEIIASLPSWSQASVVEVAGTYHVKDANGTSIARWTGTEWQDIRPGFYECNGAINWYQNETLPSGVDLPERIYDNGMRMYRLAGCMVNLRESNENDPIHSGFVLTLRLWSNLREYRDYNVHLGYFDERRNIAVGGVCHIFSSSGICEELPTDELHTIVSNAFNDPTVSKQVALEVLVEDPSMCCDVSPLCNTSIRESEALYYALNNNVELPELEWIYAGAIDIHE